MAKSRSPVRSEGKEYTLVEGSFAPQGTGAPITVRGTGFTVARSGVGVFVLTFAEIYTEMPKFVSKPQLAAFADTDTVEGPFAQGSGAVLTTQTIFVKTAGVAADIAANANNRVNFSATFRKSSVTT